MPLSLSRIKCSVLVAFLLAMAGCDKSVDALSGADGAAASGGGSTGTAGRGGTVGGSGAGGDTSLGVDGGGKIPIGDTQCSDQIDNDNDGLFDSADPECTGPLDNDEGSFATGIPGDNVDACKQDCFFDGNSGMGDDGCQWQLKCDPRSTEGSCPYDSTYAQQHATECSVSASQSQKCIDNCRNLVPNGCDCFGCCAVPGAPTPIRLAPGCTAQDFGDPTKCPPCTQVTQCSNPCDRCELCVGKDTVPADCGAPDGGVPRQMCSGHESCTPGAGAVCPSGTSCVTGCCLPVIP